MFERVFFRRLAFRNFTKYYLLATSSDLFRRCLFSFFPINKVCSLKAMSNAALRKRNSQARPVLRSYGLCSCDDDL